MPLKRVDLVEKLDYGPYSSRPAAGAANMTLYKACLQGQLPVVLDVLDSKWVKDNLSRGQRFLDEQKFTSQKNTLLHAACASGCTDLVELLVEYKAGVHVMNKSLQTPLHLAAEKGHVQIVTKLLEANADVNAASAVGVTPLHLAADKGHLQIVLKLSDARADVNAASAVGITPLHLAAEKGHVDIVRRLLEAQAEVNAASSVGVRPLHLAAERGHVEVVRKLLEAKADMDAAGNAGLTALHSATLRACRLEEKGAMLELLGQGAQLLQSKFSSSPLDIACEADSWKVVDVLLAKKSLTDIEGHVRTLFRALRRDATYIALKLLHSVQKDSTKFQLLVSALLYAQSEKENMTSMLSNVKTLFKANSDAFPGGMASLVKEAEGLQKADIVELVRAHESDESASSRRHSEDDVLDQMMAC